MTDNANIILKIEGLSIAFGSNVVLNNFNLELVKGENIVVLGKSGSGKSVLIKCIVGLLKPNKGNIYVFGTNILELDQESLDKIRTKIGFLFQNSALYDSMTVRENLEFPMRRHWISLTPSEVKYLVEESLDNVGLLHAINMMPSELSGGMRKRIGIARTLIMKPQLILYDEPTTGLDPITSREIVQLMLDLQNKYHTSSVIISHDMSVAKLTANKIIVLLDGKNYAEGTYDELKKSSDKNINQFFEFAS
ncbi:MAG TPA: ATP-binding cassette domain-containing protein [Bacteroidia bacterium]|jgi:phospholipid/cholesterol/gamma-HCH transport system ATP-binding protein|nr:ATP-binding cassette domain-containing protein [Bacteroidia bacterium]HMU19612.1 ATP-binding cassette domain-containing protein [Bacteroidia bacterium]